MVKYTKKETPPPRGLGGAERPEVLAGEDLPDALGLRAVRGVGEDLRELRGLERLAALRAGRVLAVVERGERAG